MTEHLTALRAPFPPEAIGKLPRSTCKACSDSPRRRCDQHQWVTRCQDCHGSHSSATMHIDYVGHADVTDRLLAVDPSWTWEPLGLDQMGLPALDRAGNLWIKLTVCGVTRLGVGDGKNAKEQISDALRNAAMRFGVALDLWAKGDRAWANSEKHDLNPGFSADAHTDPPPPPAPDETDSMDTPTLLLLLDSLAMQTGVTYEQITEKFRTEQGGLTVDDLDACDPVVLRPFVRRVRDYINTHEVEA